MLTTIAAGRVFNYSYCIGMYAGAGLGFFTPWDFVLGPNRTMYVINRGGEELGQRVTKCTVEHEYITQFGGGYGSGDGQFTWPVSIDVDPAENVYVADEYLQRISIFDKEGKFLSKWGTHGRADGELDGPSGIAFDREGYLYVVDTLNSRVQRFTKEGKYLGKWGTTWHW